ncbi:MAG: HEAT repeat domain-containing protein, partial [Deltaproteobacteria bacterium]|nr:HEAT repeat domain-containing protein [Deltaproteobacteria bacterium]
MAQALGLAVSAVMPSDGTRPLPELFWGTDASGATGDVSRVSGVTGPGGFTRPGYAPAPGVAQTQAQLPLAPDPGRRSPLLWILPLAVILLSGATIAAVLALKSSSKKGATPGKVVVAVGSGHGTPTSAPTAVPKSFPPIKNMDDLIFKVRRTLNQGLQSPNPEIRRRAVIGVGELHDKNIKQQLIEFLKTDPQLSVRSTAARSLAKLGDPSVIVDLKAARRTQEPIVRVAIDDALRRLHAPTGKKGLLKALASKNRGVRLAAALALGDAGDTRVRKVLEPMLTANAKITAPVLAALAKTGHKKALASLRKGLETGDAKTKLPYAEALAKLGDDNATAALKKVLTSGELPTRIVAAKNLAALGDYSGLSVLELGISHKAPQTRMLAADAFGAVGDRAALPPLAATLADTVATVKTAAAESLAKVLGLMPNKLLRRSQSWLLAALAQGDWSARNAAVGVTDEMDPELAVEILGWALKDKDARVRVAAVRRLARLAGRSAKARRYVRAHLFNDASPAVRAAAAEGLGAMGDAQAKSDLSRAAGTDKSRTLVGITAAGQLLALGDTRGLKGLLRATKAKHADTRAHAYAALSRWQDAARRRRTLRRGLKDKAAGVRLAAALALASHGQRDGQAVLTKAVEDGGPYSGRALRALARLNISQKKHVRTLARSKSASSRRTAMATAITVLGATAALPILRRGARDDDVTVRRAAARGLATLAGKQPAVGPLLRRLTRDPDAAIRAAAALGLTKLRHGKVASLKGKAIKKAPEPAEPKLPQKPKKGKKGKQPKLELSFVEDTKKEASYKELIFRAELQLRGGHY